MLLELHPWGAEFPYTFVVCGEPCGVWRKSAPFCIDLCFTKILLAMKNYYCYAAMLLALFTSCATEKYYYQVYEVVSQDVSQKENVLSYENADCQITYNLWSEGGNLSFLIHNKTDKNLYVVMPQSFFILNGVANDYYSESSYSHSVTNSAALSASRQLSISGFLTNGYYWYPSRITRQYGATIGTSTTEAIETKEMAFVCVPPKSSKFVRGFNLSDHIYKDCDNSNENYPKSSSSIVRYTKDDTPLSFRNRIAYTFNNQSSDVNYIEHQFWLSSLQNFSEKAAISKQKVEECETNARKVQRSFTMYSPNKFYNKYIMNPAVKSGFGGKKKKGDEMY